MGHWYSPMGSPCPMVQWDGMDRWDGCPSHGTLVQSHGIPLSHGTVGRDGQVGWLHQPWDIGTVPWDPLVPWYSGTGWTGGMAAPAMGHWYSPMGSPCPMVQWDGMDRWDGCTSHGTLVQSHGIPLSHGTVGRDGQVGWLHQPWDIGTVPWDPLVPWYSGTGWTGGMAAPAMGHWYSPMGSPCPMVQWDGMDRWDGCTSHGTLVQSHGIPLSHGTVGRDGQVGWLHQPWDIGTVPWDPLVPWYSGTGWKGGMGLWYNPMGSPCLMVHGIPLSHGAVGRDGQVGWEGGTIPWDPLCTMGQMGIPNSQWTFIGNTGHHSMYMAYLYLEGCQITVTLMFFSCHLICQKVLFTESMSTRASSLSKATCHVESLKFVERIASISSN